MMKMRAKMRVSKVVTHESCEELQFSAVGKSDGYPPDGSDETPERHKVDPMKVTDEMVNRFLWWKLPRDFAPDCGISFDGRKPDQWNPSREWPMGTNLFTAVQARAMLEHVLGGETPAERKP